MTNRWAPALVMCLPALACSSRPSLPAAAAPSADVSLQGVTVRTFRGSTLTLEATAPVMQLSRTTSEFAATQAHIALVDRDATVFAGSVTGNAEKQSFEGSGGVRLDARETIHAQTPSATYDGPTGQSVGHEAVHVDHPDMTLDAVGFVVNMNDETATFDHPRTRTRPPHD